MLTLHLVIFVTCVVGATLVPAALTTANIECKINSTSLRLVLGDGSIHLGNELESSLINPKVPPVAFRLVSLRRFIQGKHCA